VLDRLEMDAALTIADVLAPPAIEASPSKDGTMVASATAHETVVDAPDAGPAPPIAEPPSALPSAAQPSAVTPGPITQPAATPAVVEGDVNVAYCRTAIVWCMLRTPVPH
jgi:hypothetical protein